MLHRYSIIALLATVVAFSSCATSRSAAPQNAPTGKDTTHKQYSIDTALVATRLADAIKIPTISLSGVYAHATQPFLDFHQFLVNSYKQIHSYAERHVINKYSLVYKFRGTNPELQPGLFLAHQDVVPEFQPEKWEVDPFGGVIKEGHVYGRGSLDMKSTLIAMMEAMETLLTNGFKPQRDIYFCFGHDEELPTSEGAKEIAHWLQSQQITPAYIIDEGGTIFDAAPVGIDQRFALIGTAEKGYADITVTLDDGGNHSSLPSSPSIVARLSEIILDIEAHPMKPKLTPQLKQTLATAAPYLPRKYRWVAKHPNVLFPFVKGTLKKIPLTNTLISTINTPTLLSGSLTSNSAPQSASVTFNTRIVHGYTSQDAHQHIQKRAGKYATVTTTNCTEPTQPSSVDSPYYKALSRAIASVFHNAATVPYTFIANTDSRHYQSLCTNVYRFTPLQLGFDDQKRFHGTDERCSMSNLAAATHFFISCFQIMADIIIP